jgi:hypothetical protein
MGRPRGRGKAATPDCRGSFSRRFPRYWLSSYPEQPDIGGFMRAGASIGAFALVVLGGLTACSDSGPTRPLRPSGVRANVVPGIAVTNTNDDGAGSLRQAIADAADGATITFAPAIAGRTITVLSPLSVAHNLVVEGSTASGMTLDGNELTGIVAVAGTGNLTLRRVTISRGGFGNSIEVAAGGTLVVDHSTVSGGKGSGIRTNGTVTLTNSTVSGNSIGVFYVAGALNLIQTTITANTTFGVDIVDGGAWFHHNVILAGNGADCQLGQHFSGDGQGVILIGDNSCFGTAAGDIHLGPLANNGGPTKTHALLRTSPAIDVAGCPLADDQRGVARPQFAKCDAGAVEFNNLFKAPIVVASSSSLDPTTGAAFVSGKISCSEQGSVTFNVTLTQTLKVKGVNVTTTASDVVTLDCIGTKPWIVSFTPSTGAFVPGAATVTAQLTDAPPFSDRPSTDTQVKLVKGKP